MVSYIEPSLERALKDTVVRFNEEKAAVVKKEKEARRFVAKVDVTRRYPAAVISSVTDLLTMLPRAAYMHLEALYRAIPGMLGVMLSPDESSQSALGGHALVVKTTQPVDQLAHIVNVRSPFGVTVAVQVRNAVYTSMRDFRDRYAKRAVAFIQGLSSEGPTLADHYAAGQTEDAQRWPMFFPSKRAHVGFYCTADNKLYIVMRSHAGSNILEGIRTVVSEEGTTAGRFVADARIKWMQDIAYRNAVRVVYALARELNFEVPTSYDYKAYSGEMRLVKYRIVTPDICFAHDTQRITTRFGGEHAVFFRDYIDGSQGRGDVVLVHTDITGGYVMVDTREYTHEPLPLFAMTSGKIPVSERRPYTADERDEHMSRVVSLSARTELLTARKFRQPAKKTDLVPVLVIRA